MNNICKQMLLMDKYIVTMHLFQVTEIVEFRYITQYTFLCVLLFRKLQNNFLS